MGCLCGLFVSTNYAYFALHTPYKPKMDNLEEFQTQPAEVEDFDQNNEEEPAEDQQHGEEENEETDLQEGPAALETEEDQADLDAYELGASAPRQARPSAKSASKSAISSKLIDQLAAGLSKPLSDGAATAGTGKIASDVLDILKQMVLTTVDGKPIPEKTAVVRQAALAHYILFLALTVKTVFNAAFHKTMSDIWTDHAQTIYTPTPEELKEFKTKGIDMKEMEKDGDEVTSGKIKASLVNNPLLRTRMYPNTYLANTTVVTNGKGPKKGLLVLDVINGITTGVFKAFGLMNQELGATETDCFATIIAKMNIGNKLAEYSKILKAKGLLNDERENEKAEIIRLNKQLDEFARAMLGAPNAKSDAPLVTQTEIQRTAMALDQMVFYHDKILGLTRKDAGDAITRNFWYSLNAFIMAICLTTNGKGTASMLAFIAFYATLGARKANNPEVFAAMDILNINTGNSLGTIACNKSASSLTPLEKEMGALYSDLKKDITSTNAAKPKSKSTAKVGFTIEQRKAAANTLLAHIQMNLDLGGKTSKSATAAKNFTKEAIDALVYIRANGNLGTNMTMPQLSNAGANKEGLGNSVLSATSGVSIKLMDETKDLFRNVILSMIADNRLVELNESLADKTKPAEITAIKNEMTRMKKLKEQITVLIDEQKRSMCSHIVDYNATGSSVSDKLGVFLQAIDANPRLMTDRNNIYTNYYYYAVSNMLASYGEVAEQEGLIIKFNDSIGRIIKAGNKINEVDVILQSIQLRTIPKTATGKSESQKCEFALDPKFLATVLMFFKRR